MSQYPYIRALVLAVVTATATAVQAQQRPYIGFVYPAGGRQGTTFQVRVGGQGTEGVHDAIVSGAGISAKVIEYRRRLNSQEVQLLREQVREFRRGETPKDEALRKMRTKIEQRLDEFVNMPACASIANLVIVEVTIAADAKPGQRELRIATPRGVSNPLVFCVGQLPEVSRKPMATAEKQVLGKEQLALRRRPHGEAEESITVPCILNGQIASGEVNRYRFRARKGQRLVISTEARQLIPFIADAVPGWFQPVLMLYDSHGNEVAYNDDYRFSPDPLILYQPPANGEYVLAIYDSLYRGREDFVYRISIGETPFLTSIFPLGGGAGSPAAIEMKGWNLQGAQLSSPAADARPGIFPIVARTEKLVSNCKPFAIDTLPECFDEEPNDDPAQAQKVSLPTIVNGRIDRRDDWDVFQFSARAGDTIVAEVHARRLDSPLDSVLKLTDVAGKLLAYNDDHDDPDPTANTHYSDSYFMATLSADGTYCVHIGDTARNGGAPYAYRLRLSPPRPDFSLKVVPSSAAIRSRSSLAVGVEMFPKNGVGVQVVRKEGFSGAVTLSVKDPPRGFSSDFIPQTRQKAPQFNIRTTLLETEQPATLRIEGRATIQGREVSHEAVAAEDRMQAFLWRHFAPAGDFKLAVFDPRNIRDARLAQVLRRPAPAEKKPATSTSASEAPAKPKFTRQQVAGRLRQLRILFDDGLLTEDFYNRKVAECEAAL